MSYSNSKSLRDVLAADYESLARRLTRCLGSPDVAREALHEAFVRADRVSDAIPVRSPVDYLFRMALNLAKDHRKSERRLLNASEIEAIMALPDERPGPAAEVEARFELEQFEKALAELPPRKRDVFICAHLELMPHREIAQRFSINVRTVEFDLQHAMEHLGRRLGRKVVRRFGPRAVSQSSNRS
ncbi:MULTISPECIES: RNA polymerase sigma factor [unclassified Bradyrhizobium]|uniref:RNA polymerase sigma factor n=1 Tax=Bradyrhizobium TaxID=374 RepID=UPI0028E73878|nr:MULTISPECIES: RNA polymerase sigma factor [unclassified Bradyrhizobium]